MSLTVTATNFSFAVGVAHKKNVVVWSANAQDTSLHPTAADNSALTVDIPAALLSSPVTAKVRVEVWDDQADAPDRTTDSVSFSVTNPAPAQPVINSISPTSAASGTPGPYHNRDRIKLQSRRQQFPLGRGLVCER
jgi:hypothetical protein